MGQEVQSTSLEDETPSGKTNASKVPVHVCKEAILGVDASTLAVTVV